MKPGSAISPIAIAALLFSCMPAARADTLDPLLPLVDAAAQRLQTADPVAASKFLTGGQVDDPKREQQVIDSVTADASRQHIDTNYNRDAYKYR